jgi:hypothetical protein
MTSKKIIDALAKAETRMKLFKRMAQLAAEQDWELRPQEMWEPADDEALAALEYARNEISGARSLFEEAV